jgi:putative ATP-dependent endonuclease of the OLD family
MWPENAAERGLKNFTGVTGPVSASAITPAVAAIYHLSIERFRGIKTLSWRPTKGLNIILGGGDVGKTTILDAIGLLLSPTNPSVLLDSDYHARDDKAGFIIEATISLPPATGINEQLKASWPWNWNGTAAVVPDAEGEGSAAAEPVYRLRVRGTEDLELVYEIVQPDGGADSLPVALRRAIGLVRLSGDDRNDRDLRLVQGSALDRLLSDKGLRSRLGSELAKSDVKSELSDPAKEALKALDKAFREKTLPEGLDLAITGSQGLSITALIGLTAQREGVQLPLASWGAGTRRLSALAIAEQNQGESPITLVDEVERGLELYRQRALIEKLQAGKSQVFVTTHSAAAVSAVSAGTLWFLDSAGVIGHLNRLKIGRHQQRDPETFLSRVSIIAEGATEVGVVSALAEKALASPVEQHGIHVSDGGGHEATLNLLEALADGGLRFGGFADDEGKHSGRWEKLATSLGALLFRWPSGSLEQNVIAAVPDDKLEAFLNDPLGDKTGMRLRTLADRLEIEEKDFPTIKAKAGPGLKALMLEAALGKIPAGKEAEEKEFKAHERIWFKSIDGGRELANKLFSLGLWPDLKPQLLPFFNALRQAVNLPEISDLGP